MIPIPSIRISQQYGRIGIDADLGTYDIKQPQATLEMRNAPAKVDIQSPRAELVIDQTRAWEALNGGSTITSFGHRLYSQMKDVLLQGIARTVENGNRLAAIHLQTHAIADIAQEQSTLEVPLTLMGPASIDNVDIEFIPHKPIIEITPTPVEVNIQVNKPSIDYTRGKLDIYMRQYPRLDITSPQIDLQM